ncbi:MAG: LuxR C-terminal-related transcriptional regulator [Sphingomonadaceae bacterium]|nr:LuxR C-terminal-related transcriptional regulator [Sphingomonadaceae bacterium]
MPVTSPLLPTDELIELIYNGPLEPTPWLKFLVALGQRIGCRSAGLTLRLSRQGRPPLVIWGNPLIDQEAAKRITAAHAELGHLDPLRNALNKPGDLHTLDEVISREALHESEFYRRIYKPYGIEHALGMYISEPGGWEGNVGLINGSDAPNFTAADREMLGALRPHLERSLAIFANLQGHQSELQVLTETLDRLTISTFILDDRGRVLLSNGAGEALGQRGSTIRIADGRLRIVNRTDDARFQAIIERAIASRGRSAETFVDALRIDGAEAQNLGVLVRSVGRSLPFLSDPAPALIVYISGSTEARPIERLVMQLFDLTPSEAQLATLLASGLTIAESAERLGLTENTARTYSKIIFSKTGVGRQAELIRLILRSVAVLG